MPLIEIDEDQAKRDQASRILLDTLGNNPKTALAIRHLIKAVNPAARIPEVDVPAAFHAQVVKPMAEKIGSLEKMFTDDRAARDQASTDTKTQKWIDEGRSSLRKRGYLDDGIAKVEALMTERNLADYEAAAALLESTSPKDEPIMPTMNRSWDFGMPDDSNDKHKLLLKNPRKFAMDEVNAFFTERHRAARR